MKTIPVEFTKKGFHHKQLFREGMNAIYERWKDGQRPHYEVITIGSHDGYEIGGAKIEPSETYPSAEQFGSKAWNCPTLASAIVRFNELNKSNP